MKELQTLHLTPLVKILPKLLNLFFPNEDNNYYLMVGHIVIVLHVTCPEFQLSVNLSTSRLVGVCPVPLGGVETGY